MKLNDVRPLSDEKEKFISLMPNAWTKYQKELAWKFILILDEHYQEFDSHVVSDLLHAVPI